MTMTIIVACSRCGRLMLAKAEQKTRACPYCGSKIDLTRAKKLASSQDPYEASEMLRRLKDESPQ